MAHLNCHPLLPNVNHFDPFSIPHIELSPLWGPREGRGDVAIHSPRTLRSLWYGLLPTTSLISLAINKCVASTLRITTALPFTLFAVPITQETTDNAFPALRVKGHLIAASKSEATGTETLDFTRLSGLFIGTAEYQVEGSFVILMWALLLRCATSQVMGILG